MEKLDKYAYHIFSPIDIFGNKIDHYNNGFV